MALMLCGSLLMPCQGVELTASERAKAERLAVISRNRAARNRLQTLLEIDQLDDVSQNRAPLLSMLTGEASDDDDEGGEVRASSGTSLPTSSATSMLDEIKKRQGAGFKLAFYPGNSTVYDPLRSKTFKVVPKQMFLLQYADNSALKGFQSRDIVRLGDYSVEAKFGSITDCNSPDFNGVDGIMGFGMPVKTPPPAADP